MELLGISTVSYDKTGVELCSKFSNCVRIVFSWRNIQPDLVDFNWDVSDELINHAIQHKLRIIADIGDGFVNEVPLFNGAPFVPNIVGKDLYLQKLQAYVTAFVQRYRDKIALFQIERELNQAFFAGLWGWRDFSLGGAWKDWGFLTEIIASTSSIVRAHNCQVTTQFHTDIHPKLNQSTKTKTWIDAIGEWSEYLDIVGIGAYPNYIRATPVESIEQKLQNIKEITDVPILIIESGYPIAANPDRMPNLRKHTPINQAEYAKQNIISAFNSGAIGYLYFAPHSGNGFYYPYTREDIEVMTKLALAMDTGDIRYFYEVLSKSGSHYLTSRLPSVLQSTESGFIMFNDKWEPLPVTLTISNLFKNMKPIMINLRRGNNLVGLPYKPIGVTIMDLFKIVNANVIIYMDRNGKFEVYTDRDDPIEMKPGDGYIFVCKEDVTLVYWGEPW
ncbi:glycosyl hydrolase 53 family protein [Candidatus Poribacteria bacterium]|nr:glycosyl hydrolase 53 family protein [Candidatus Poribacteria bacterium]